MENFELGITGKFPSVAVAKRTVQIAAATMFLLTLVWALQGRYVPLGLSAPLGLFMVYSYGRGAALMSFMWMLLVTFWSILVSLPFMGGSLQSLYLPILCLIILWFQYRAIRATLFLKAESVANPEVPIDSMTNIFE